MDKWNSISNDEQRDLKTHFKRNMENKKKNHWMSWKQGKPKILDNSNIEDGSRRSQKKSSKILEMFRRRMQTKFTKDFSNLSSELKIRVQLLN